MKTTGDTFGTRCAASAWRFEAKRFALPIAGSLIALFLAGCETSSNTTSEAAVSSLSAPQEQAGQVKPVAFAPVIGAPAAISTKMNERLIAAAGQSNVPVGSSNEADYTIRGYLVAASDPNGTKLSYIWDITDKTGKRAKRFQGDELIEGKKGGDPWALVDDQAIDRIAVSTAGKISEWMSGANANAAPVATSNVVAPAPAVTASAPQQEPVQETRSAGVLSAQAAEPPVSSEQPAAAQGPVVAIVPPVTGAPGDGQTSLTSAMRRHLESAGVKLVDGNPPNAYLVKGSVQLGASDAGQQPITIRWLVVDPSGKTMEKAVVQRNKVPEGSLNGTWGQIADLAASEAAKSVARLIKPTG